MNNPLFYQQVNVAESYNSPNTVHVRNTRLFHYYRKYLLQKLLSVYKWELPETFDEGYFLYNLFINGYICIIKTDKFGIICQNCGLSGSDIYYRPTHATIANKHLAGILQPKIGIQCELIKLSPDYEGVLDIVDFYADILALCAESVSINLVNSKLAYVFSAANKAAAESLKKVFDDINRGDPASFIDKNLLSPNGDLPVHMFNQNLRNTYIAGDILENMRSWERKFDTEIGIPNSMEDKKERMIVDEVNSNNFEVKCRAEFWLDCMKKDVEKVNKMFKTSISVDFREEGDDERENKLSRIIPEQ